MRLERAWVLIGIILVTLLFALATGHPMFWRSVYVLSALVVIALMWVLVMRLGVDVEVRRPSLRTSAGGSIQERVTVTRRSRLQKGILELWERTTMPVTAPSAAVDLSEGDVLSLDLELPCPKRGLFKVGPLAVASADPFGLFQVRRSLGKAEDVVVHPKTVELPGFVLLPADLPGDGPRHIRSIHMTTSAFGVRDYASGDSLNRISWAATAHHGRLMVKEFEVEPANNVWVLLDLDRNVQSGSGQRSTEETSISIAASVCRRYIDVNYPVGLMAWGTEPLVIPAQRGSGHLITILDALAAARALGIKPLLEVIGYLHDRAGRYTSVAIVTSATGTTDWLDGVAYLLERRARITVVVVDSRPAGSPAPAPALKAAALGIPTYTVRAGEEAEGLTSLLSTPAVWDPLTARMGRSPS